MQMWGVVNLRCPTTKLGQRIAWKASCGCYAITGRRYSGKVREDWERGIDCNGCAGRSVCLCVLGECMMCKRKDRGEQATLLREVKELVAWVNKEQGCEEVLLFTEVPLLQSPDQEESSTLYVDCVVVLSCVLPTCARNNCLLAIELDGTSHTHCFPVEHDAIKGVQHQAVADSKKEECVKAHNMSFMRVGKSHNIKKELGTWILERIENYKPVPESNL